MISAALWFPRLNSGLFFLFSSPARRRSRNIFPSTCLGSRRIWKKNSMSLAARRAPSVEDGVLRINGLDVLVGVPENIVISSPSAGNVSAFLGAVAGEKSPRHVFKLGVLQDYRLLCLFRPTIWWMIPRMGSSGSDIPVETQMLLLEALKDFSVDEKKNDISNKSAFYILFLPVLDGPFRSSLQGNSANELEFCIESGDPAVEASRFLEAVFINYGSNPFDLMKESMSMLEKQKGTFSLRENKKIPGILDWFGWCTWDAFYTNVTPQGIKDGLKSLSEGGIPARFLIIDDGWQDMVNEVQKKDEPFVEGSQFAARLVSIKENNKFRHTANVAACEESNDLRDFITSIKKTFGLKYVYVWHALLGYWGGLHPDAPGTRKYSPQLLYPVQSPGNLANVRDIAMDSLEKYGLGTVNPAKVFEFYDDLHKYLVSQNVDGVKVDIQNVIETLGIGFGGRVSLTQQYQRALQKSVSQTFKDNGLIGCMGHNTDSFYSSKTSAVTRASEDYMPRDLYSQTLHVATVAYNSIFLGEIVVPDWDMFHSHHYAAEFHAAARALGGCGIYVSDKPNQHDFNLLKRLVLSDGSVLRARYPGRPTRDCLFNDPVMDGTSLLKIWNLNTHCGVLGIFNCQGAGTWPFPVGEQDNTSPRPPCLMGCVSPSDIEYLEDMAGKSWTGYCAVYSFNTGSLSRLHKDDSLTVSLEVLQCNVFTISPIKIYSNQIQFAPIGLIEMYNSGGAVEVVDSFSDCSICHFCIKGRGSGLFGAYSNKQPKHCTVNSKQEEFEFNSKENFLSLKVPVKIHSWEIVIYF